MIAERLSSLRLRNILLAANVLMGVLVVYIFRTPHGDLGDYLPLADGILHGTYSMWYRLPVDIPDTFRNPGYPLFLALFRAIGPDLLWVQAAQVLLHALSVLLILRIVGRLGGLIAQNIFLLLLLPSINVLYFSTGIYPETPTMFFACLFLWCDTGMRNGWKRHVWMALCVGAAFQCRSPLLLFPLARVLAELVFDRSAFRWRGALLFLGVFGLTLLPFSLWNLKHHGVFRATSIESGGGVMHLGWWAGKIPGHQEWWYWGNFFAPELIQFTDDVPGSIAAFDAECRELDSLLRPHLTAVDTLMLASRGPGLHLKTYNTAYTLERERLLKETTWRHIREEPVYTLKLKSYAAVRLWVTGLDVERVRTASWPGRIAATYPFLLTLGIFLLAITVVPIALWKERSLVRRLLPLWTWVIYSAVIYVPFAIQARYTIPVRFMLFALIALCAEQLFRSHAGTDRPDPAR